MDTAVTIKEVREKINRIRKDKKRIGFIPTMGYLHKGHLSLVELSGKYAQYNVMSIFVNRMQFNEANDFNTYPKDIERDIKLAEEAGIDLLFLPDDNEIYIDNLTYVDVDILTENLCGAYRPGHFKGVFTVLSKLFNIIRPDIAVFGQKDIQQIVGIEKMTADLNFPIKIIIAPIIREKDGLAMSSRNKHLSSRERKNATAIYMSLKEAEKIITAGERDVSRIIAEMKKIIKNSRPEKIEYISAVKYSDLSLVKTIQEKSVIAVAVFYGTTRLIDNMIVDIENNGTKCIY